MQNRTAYDPYAWQPRSSRRRVGTALATALCAACLAFAGLMLLPGLLGYQRYVITSGSMTGTYDRGSIVFEQVLFETFEGDRPQKSRRHDAVGVEVVAPQR